MKNDIEKIRDKINTKSDKIRQLFSSELGKEVIDFLKAEFDHLDIMSDTPDRTAYKLGQRDVVKYIEQAMTYSEKRNE